MHLQSDIIYSHLDNPDDSSPTPMETGQIHGLSNSLPKMNRFPCLPRSGFEGLKPVGMKSRVNRQRHEVRSWSFHLSLDYDVLAFTIPPTGVNRVERHSLPVSRFAPVEKEGHALRRFSLHVAS